MPLTADSGTLSTKVLIFLWPIDSPTCWSGNRKTYSPRLYLQKPRVCSRVLNSWFSPEVMQSTATRIGEVGSSTSGSCKASHVKGVAGMSPRILLSCGLIAPCCMMWSSKNHHTGLIGRTGYSEYDSAGGTLRFHVSQYLCLISCVNELRKAIGIKVHVVFSPSTQVVWSVLY